MIPEFYRVKRPYYGIHSSYMFNLKHFIAMKLLKVEAIEDLFAVFVRTIILEQKFYHRRFEARFIGKNLEIPTSDLSVRIRKTY
ncbi:hypothetical protein HMPREF0654_11650 [Prevotella disiens DNF00882]|uniref:Uncharacterized protein n=1 Tax=Prevotella disiens DNF00882 TaxID=1401075 RepID=A0A096CLS1_9BACT|nr:hypothetical protein HMPREF0654_11650 [Prevotella disiens DNF00882]